MVRERAGLAETRRRGDDPARRSRRCSTSTCRTRRSAAGSSPRCSRCSASETRRRRRSSCSPPGGRSSSGSPRTAPVVLVFEDLHYADPGLLDFIDHLLEWSRERPDLRRHAGPARAARAPAGLGRRQAQLHLDLPRAAADDDDARAARGPRARAAGPRRSPRIVARADGIPLYAVETVRMLARRGPARRARTAPTGPTATSTSLAVPETLTALIARRLDALDAERPGARPGRRRPRPELHAGRPRRRSSGTPEDDARAAPARPSSGASSSTLDADPRSPGARPVRVRPGAHPRGRLQHARQARPQGAATSPRRATSRALETDELAGALAGTTSPRTRTRARAPKPTRWPPRRGSRSRRRPTGRPRSGPTSRRSACSRTRCASAPTRRSVPSWR